MKINKKVITVNGNEKVGYEYNGKLFEKLSDLLRKNFTDQGEFYEVVAGVSRMDSEIAGWHPRDNEFTIRCDGWKQFLADGGKIKKVEEVISVDVMDEIFSVLNKEN